MSDPKTPEQWQQAVDLAAAARVLADCKMYGLIEGGPVIDVARCDEILDVGARLGVRPSKPTVELALELVASWNDPNADPA